MQFLKEASPSNRKIHSRKWLSDPQLDAIPKVLRKVSFPPPITALRPFDLLLKFEVAVGGVAPARTVGFVVQFKRVTAMTLSVRHA
jgi:hypothetical protein